jgi:hypothetical protein
MEVNQGILLPYVDICSDEFQIKETQAGNQRIIYITWTRYELP